MCWYAYYICFKGSLFYSFIEITALQDLNNKIMYYSGNCIEREKYTQRVHCFMLPGSKYSTDV